MGANNEAVDDMRDLNLELALEHAQLQLVIDSAGSLGVAESIASVPESEGEE